MFLFVSIFSRYFLRWRERHRVKYDISYYCQYNEETKANEFFYNRIKLIWPRNYSYRIQCIESHRFSGYYFPPIRKHVKDEEEEKPRTNEFKEDNEENDTDNHNNDDSDDAVGSGNDKKEGKEEVDEGSLPERNVIGEKDEDQQNAGSTNNLLWTCIYRDMKKRNRSDDEETAAVFGKPTEVTPSEASNVQKKPKL
jgi:hypothetical protein